MPLRGNSSTSSSSTSSTTTPSTTTNTAPTTAAAVSHLPVHALRSQLSVDTNAGSITVVAGPRGRSSPPALSSSSASEHGHAGNSTGTGTSTGSLTGTSSTASVNSDSAATPALFNPGSGSGLSSGADSGYGNFALRRTAFPGLSNHHTQAGNNHVRMSDYPPATPAGATPVSNNNNNNSSSNNNAQSQSQSQTARNGNSNAGNYNDNNNHWQRRGSVTDASRAAAAAATAQFLAPRTPGAPAPASASASAGAGAAGTAANDGHGAMTWGANLGGAPRGGSARAQPPQPVEMDERRRQLDELVLMAQDNYRRQLRMRPLMLRAIINGSNNDNIRQNNNDQNSNDSSSSGNDDDDDDDNGTNRDANANNAPANDDDNGNDGNDGNNNTLASGIPPPPPLPRSHSHSLQSLQAQAQPLSLADLARYEPRAAAIAEAEAVRTAFAQDAIPDDVGRAAVARVLYQSGATVTVSPNPNNANNNNGAGAAGTVTVSGVGVSTLAPWAGREAGSAAAFINSVLVAGAHGAGGLAGGDLSGVASGASGRAAAAEVYRFAPSADPSAWADAMLAYTPLPDAVTALPIAAQAAGAGAAAAAAASAAAARAIAVAVAKATAASAQTPYGGAPVIAFTPMTHHALGSNQIGNSDGNGNGNGSKAGSSTSASANASTSDSSIKTEVASSTATSGTRGGLTSLSATASARASGGLDVGVFPEGPVSGQLAVVRRWAQYRAAALAAATAMTHALHLLNCVNSNGCDSYDDSITTNSGSSSSSGSGGNKVVDAAAVSAAVADARAALAASDARSAAHGLPALSLKTLPHFAAALRLPAAPALAPVYDAVLLGVCGACDCDVGPQAGPQTLPQTRSNSSNNSINSVRSSDGSDIIPAWDADSDDAAASGSATAAADGCVVARAKLLFAPATTLRPAPPCRCAGRAVAVPVVAAVVAERSPVLRAMLRAPFGERGEVARQERAERRAEADPDAALTQRVLGHAAAGAIAAGGTDAGVDVEARLQAVAGALLARVCELSAALAGQNVDEDANHGQSHSVDNDVADNDGVHVITRSHTNGNGSSSTGHSVAAAGLHCTVTHMDYVSSILASLPTASACALGAPPKRACVETTAQTDLELALACALVLLPLHPTLSLDAIGGGDGAMGGAMGDCGDSDAGDAAAAAAAPQRISCDALPEPGTVAALLSTFYRISHSGNAPNVGSSVSNIGVTAQARARGRGRGRQGDRIVTQPYSQRLAAAAALRRAATLPRYTLALPLDAPRAEADPVDAAAATVAAVAVDRPGPAGAAAGALDAVRLPWYDVSLAGDDDDAALVDSAALAEDASTTSQSQTHSLGHSHGRGHGQGHGSKAHSANANAGSSSSLDAIASSSSRHSQGHSYSIHSAGSTQRLAGMRRGGSVYSHIAPHRPAARALTGFPSAAALHLALAVTDGTTPSAAAGSAGAGGGSGGDGESADAAEADTDFMLGIGFGDPSVSAASSSASSSSLAQLSNPTAVYAAADQAAIRAHSSTTESNTNPAVASLVESATFASAVAARSSGLSLFPISGGGRDAVITNYYKDDGTLIASLPRPSSMNASSINGSSKGGAHISTSTSSFSGSLADPIRAPLRARSSLSPVAAAAVRRTQLAVADPGMLVALAEFCHRGAAPLRRGGIAEVLSLYSLADWLLVPSLPQQCEVWLGDSLSATSVLATLQHPVASRLPDLRQLCLEFIDDNAAAVLAHPRLGALPQGVMCDILARDSLAVAEPVAFNAAKTWGVAQLQRVDEYTMLEAIELSVAPGLRGAGAGSRAGPVGSPPAAATAAAAAAAAAAADSRTVVKNVDRVISALTKTSARRSHHDADADADGDPVKSQFDQPTFFHALFTALSHRGNSNGNNGSGNGNITGGNKDEFADNAEQQLARSSVRPSFSRRCSVSVSAPLALALATTTAAGADAAAALASGATDTASASVSGAGSVSGSGRRSRRVSLLARSASLSISPSRRLVMNDDGDDDESAIKAEASASVPNVDKSKSRVSGSGSSSSSDSEAEVEADVASSRAGKRPRLATDDFPGLSAQLSQALPLPQRRQSLRRREGVGSTAQPGAFIATSKMAHVRHAALRRISLTAAAEDAASAWDSLDLENGSALIDGDGDGDGGGGANGADNEEEEEEEESDGADVNSGRVGYRRNAQGAIFPNNDDEDNDDVIHFDSLIHGGIATDSDNDDDVELLPRNPAVESRVQASLENDTAHSADSTGAAENGPVGTSRKQKRGLSAASFTSPVSSQSHLQPHSQPRTAVQLQAPAAAAAAAAARVYAKAAAAVALLRRNNTADAADADAEAEASATAPSALSPSQSTSGAGASAGVSRGLERRLGRLRMELPWHTATYQTHVPYAYSTCTGSKAGREAAVAVARILVAGHEHTRDLDRDSINSGNGGAQVVDAWLPIPLVRAAPGGDRGGDRDGDRDGGCCGDRGAVCLHIQSLGLRLHLETSLARALIAETGNQFELDCDGDGDGDGNGQIQGNGHTQGHGHGRVGGAPASASLALSGAGLRQLNRSVLSVGYNPARGSLLVVRAHSMRTAEISDFSFIKTVRQRQRRRSNLKTSLNLDIFTHLTEMSFFSLTHSHIFSLLHVCICLTDCGAADAPRALPADGPQLRLQHHPHVAARL